MNRALVKLMVLNAKAGLRRLFQGARTVRGAIVIIFLILLLALVLIPAFFAVALRNNPAGKLLSGLIDPYLPLLLLALAVTSAINARGGHTLYFSPSEIDFLFPAPFHRRELLVYKIVQVFIGLVLASLFFASFCSIYVHSWLSAFVGIVLFAGCIRLVALVLAFLGQIVAEQAYTRGRQLVLLGIGVLVVGGLGQMLWQTRVESPAELARSFRGSWTGRVVLAPFEVFSHTILAREWFPELVCWGAAALAIDAGLLALVFKLDADYLEMAAAVSAKVYERIQRIKQGGGIATPASAKAARIRLGRFPWLGGTGPIAWRQALITMRTSRSALVGAVGLSIPFAVCNLVADRGPMGAGFVPIMSVSLIAYMSFVYAMQLPWAFRGDVAHIETLKSLPIAPLPVATGELVGGMIMLVGMQVIVSTGLLVTGGNPVLVFTALALMIPSDALVLAMGNTVFLIYPIRPGQTTPVDFQMVGRMILTTLLKLLLLVPTLGVPAAIGGLAYVLIGFHFAVFAGVAWVMLVAELPLWLFLLASAFSRFDPGTETPP